MKYIRKYLKLITAFFGINFLSSLLAPNIAYALTSGPTAPEYTSFEPVDTTDMVNLATGDFVYNLPLLEVPGPAGGYPLSLSYHAGIMPDEEASWVGLGFTLNPGAITRTVNGYPDDQYGATRTRHDYNDGGERRTFSVGVGVPGASFGISVSHDTNLGLGMGQSFSVGYSLFNSDDNAIGLGVNATFGVDAYGNTYSGIGAGLSIGKGGAKAKGLSYSIGVSTNFNSVSLNGGVSYRENSAANRGRVGTVSSQSLVGGSISSKGLKPSATVAGISVSQHNSRANNWTTYGHGFSIPVPLPGVLLTLGYRYLRYYIDETSDVNVIGTYHGEKTFGKNYDDWSYDSYALIEVEEDFTEQEPEKDRGGSFPAYDHYSVNAQGLSGSIRPFYTRVGHLMRQNLKKNDDEYEIKYVQDGDELRKPHFRFVNDFSNALKYDESAKLNSSAFQMEEGSPNIGEGTEGGKLAGSKDVVTYTNLQIKQGEAFDEGFIDYQSHISRATEIHGGNVSEQIGGYKITNESGVTYHYALPVYNYDEYSRNENGDEPNDEYTEYDQRDPYAYTWLLTAITGPDFVDRGGGAGSNPNGILDEDDWGYWVKFDYGKWTDQYFWRNPGEGRHADLDSKYKSFSEGTKELYYLDAIQTKTHTALFIKDVRNDAKSALKFIRNKNIYNASNGGWESLNPTDEHREGGFGSKTLQTSVRYLIAYNGTIEYESKPTKTLKLDKILLVENKDIPSISTLRTRGDWPSDIRTYQWPRSSSGSINEILDEIGDISFNQHLHDNVLDVRDFSSNSYLDKALRVIDLETSYELAKGVPNSTSGKLTLEGIKFLGKGGTAVTPDMKFYYDKNPDWKKDHHDVWGFYKSDYEDLDNENLSRRVTLESTKNVDAWSLSKVRTSLGSKILIDYESDSYSKTALYKNAILPIESIGKTGEMRRLKIPSNLGIDLTELFETVSEISVPVQYKYEKKHDGLLPPGGCYDLDPLTEKDLETQYIYESSVVELEINNVKEHYIEVYGDPLIELESKVINKFFRVGEGQQSSCYFIQYNGSDSKGTLNAGNLSTTMGFNTFGGGLRVRSIAIENNVKFSKTNYNYSVDQNQSSGRTSYEPYGLGIAVYLNSEDLAVSDKNEYQTLLNNELYQLLKLSREVQAPGVVYEYVTVTEEVDGKPVPGKQVYNFQVFEERFVERDPIRDFSEAGEVVSDCDCEAIRSECEASFSSDPCGNGTPCADLLSECNQNGEITEPGTISYIAPMTIKDYTTRVGNLKSVKTYGENDQLIMETSTEYQYDKSRVVEHVDGEKITHWEGTNANFRNALHDKFNDQGATQEMFTEYRVIREDGSYKARKVISKKEYYPAVVVGTRTKNYKTGITTESQNLAFDFFTGDVTASYSDDGYGNKYVTKSMPAYYFYEDMGLAVDGGKNMLTQEGASFSYLMDDDFDPDAFTYEDEVSASAVGLMGASMQTWSKAIASIDGNTRYSDPVSEIADNIYRKHASYSHIGLPTVSLAKDGSYPKESFTELTRDNYLTQLEAADWQKNSEITLYDVNSHALEAMDVNGNYAATKFDRANKRVMGTVANAQYKEFYLDQDFSITNGMPSGLHAHAGPGAALLGSDGKLSIDLSLSELLPNKKYRLSYWAKADNISVVKPFITTQYGTSYPEERFGDTRSVTVNGSTWYLQEMTFSIPSKTPSFEIGCQVSNTVYVDNIRLMPLDASSTAYEYNSWGELSHILDNNNLFTHYKYDKMGRLKSVTRETLDHGPVLASMADIHYGKGEEPNIDGVITVDYSASGNALFTFEFTQKPEGVYTYEWKVNGKPISGFSSANYEIQDPGDHYITVKVANSTTDQVFSTYQKRNLEVCTTAGTLISSVCEKDSDGCFTGYVVKTFAKGDCTTKETREYNSAQCQPPSSSDGEAPDCGLVKIE